MTEAHACEQLEQGCYLEADRLRLETATFCVASKRSMKLRHTFTVVMFYNKNWWNVLFSLSSFPCLPYLFSPLFFFFFLRAGVPHQYVTKPTRSTQPCIPLGSLDRVPALIGWGKCGNVTSFSWQVASHIAREFTLVSIRVYRYWAHSMGP